MGNWTAGEWTVDIDGVICADGWPIGSIVPTDRDANARLISAAPDMYEALTAFLHFAENNGESVFAHFGMAAIDRMNEATEKARAALAKARGQ